MEKLGKKMKHNHLLTNLLKFGIFSLVMLAPMFSVASRCLYVICNKNAIDSYSDTSAMTTTLISDNTQTIVGNNYMINLLSSGSSYSDNIFINSSTIDYDYIAGTTISYNVAGIRFYPNNTHFRLIESNLSSHNYELNDEKRNYLNGQSFNLASGNLISQGNQAVRFYMISFTTGKLDNVFEYSLSQLEESSYYNWTTNLGIYTPIHNMTSGLGAHDIVALLIAYWSIYIAIYIVFDIVIVCFTKISHLINGE